MTRYTVTPCSCGFVAFVLGCVVGAAGVMALLIWEDSAS